MSNAIVLVRDGMLVGLGSGQVSRVDACRDAVDKARQFQGEAGARGASAASDAFFPFPDGPQLLLDAGVSAIVQPGGSMRDAEVLALRRARRRRDARHRPAPFPPLARRAPDRDNPHVSNDDIVRRYCQSFADRDFAAAEALRAPGWEVHWPQTGERVTSSAAMRAIIEAYPGGPWTGVERRLIGAEDSLVVTPLGQVVADRRQRRHLGGRVGQPLPRRHATGSWSTSIQLQDGRVLRETTYWAQVLDAPPWRREWVELDAPACPPDDRRPGPERHDRHRAARRSPTSCAIARGARVELSAAAS